MSIFDLDDPTENAEDKMSDALGCIVIGVVGAIASVALLAWLIWRSLR